MRAVDRDDGRAHLQAEQPASRAARLDEVCRAVCYLDQEFSQLTPAL